MSNPALHRRNDLLNWLVAAIAVASVVILLNSGILAQGQPPPNPRIDEARAILAKQLGSGALPGAAIDEMLKVVREAGDKDIEPLMRRIRLLDKVGAEYAEDLALWWEMKGRREVGGPILWDKESLRAGFNAMAGIGGPPDENKARKAFEASAKSGYAPARMMELFSRPRGGSRREYRDVAEQLEAAKIADEVRTTADKGDPLAAWTLVLCEGGGWYPGAVATHEITREYVKTAADANIAPAMTMLANTLMRENGDKEQAAALYKRAADAGHAEAIEAYAGILAAGIGVPADPAKACAMRDKALGSGGDAYIKSKVSRARADMRSLATALESYFVDCNQYPASTNDPATSVDSQLLAANPGFAGRYAGFRRNMGGTDKSMTLTTPIAYVTAIGSDQFAPLPGMKYSYMRAEPQSSGAKRGKHQWLLWSAGPDGVIDLSGTAAELDPSVPFSPPALLSRTYDPTNGVISSGDVWRVQE